ncbi:peptide transporter PTR2 [Nannizzia gypsea CBS 118893]|uniref:Peptide transporter PTR2 n=1 Tax=Arthroderma gypseum (strain ATCC MYA-4604 / CBS 118893) TaxID=535722 RepID=E4V6Y5_ARTGP|nr:peptide transporter PTR2 [Nannizzia gypsea CBS 118893]EFQ96851.1 peptide transporter PTR2 [Nannizzia gypsea CBS 118893]
MKSQEIAVENQPSLAHELPSEYDIQELQHVPAPLPLRVWLAALVAMTERFAYYGTQSLFQNYIQNSPTDIIPGAMGLGKSHATTGDFCLCKYLRFNFDVALPEHQLRAYDRAVPWSKDFASELRDALSAFKICVGWPIFWVCMGEDAQISVSQAGQMETHGVPNDLIKSSNPIAYVTFGVIVQKLLYPLLQRYKIRFGPINRITLGFAIISVAMAYAAVVQAIIYRAGPCYMYPLACPASSGGKIPNRVHVLFQLPTYIIVALAEVFCWPTGSEYVYSHSPNSMKSILQACYIGTAALGISSVWH